MLKRCRGVSEKTRIRQHNKTIIGNAPGSVVKKSSNVVKSCQTF